MPGANGFTIGQDVSLSLITSELGPLTISLITGFTAKPIIDTQSPLGLDGIPRHVQFWKGWQGSFQIDRRDATLDAYFALKEANYWAGIPAAADSITQIIQEANGTVSQYRYTGVILTYEDAGDYKGDSTVHQSFMFMSSKRLQIS